MTELSFDDIYLEPSSVVDPIGKVFYFDGRIFRGIAAPYIDFVERTIELASRRKWSDVGLIPTWRSDYSLPGYPLVLEHKRIPFITLRGEWSGEGLRDAALCILNVSAELARCDLYLKDAHAWNILFDGTRPYFVDWGSIASSAELDWHFWYTQFRQFILAPLYAFSIGEHKIARAMLREHKVGVGNEIIDLPDTRNRPDIPRRIAQSAGSNPSPATFEALAGYIEALNIPNVEGEWTSYAQPRFADLDDFTELREKDRIVHRILGEDTGKTLIDVGTNKGLHSEIAAALGKRVVACDIEETCLNSLYIRARTHGSDILPLFHDFLWPIGTSGILNSIPAAEQRLSCDTALVMALTHHLAFKHHVSFEAMAGGISALAKRRAIVEFVPAEDEHVARWSPERLAWYNLNNFIVAMKRYFRSYSIVPSEPQPRCVVVFERRFVTKAAYIRSELNTRGTPSQISGQRERLINRLSLACAELDEVKSELESSRAAPNAAQAELESAHAAIHYHRQIANGLEQQIQAIYQSYSWRITAPLRWMVGTSGLSLSAVKVHAGALFRRAARYVIARPRLRNAALALLDRLPGVTSRLSRIPISDAAPEVTAAHVPIYPAHLTPRARQTTGLLSDRARRSGRN